MDGGPLCGGGRGVALAVCLLALLLAVLSNL